MQAAMLNRPTMRVADTTEVSGRVTTGPIKYGLYAKKQSILWRIGGLSVFDLLLAFAVSLITSGFALSANANERKTTIIQLRKATQLFIVVVCFGFSPAVWAVNPAPDGAYPNGNTAEGDSALFSLTTGFRNTAIGANALFSLTTGGNNTATGEAALESNTTGSGNTATGSGALLSNTTASNNTATGSDALVSNTTGDNNTAVGFQALFNNTTTQQGEGNGGNTATGSGALFHNTTGSFNTATGSFAMQNNTTGFDNTANGSSALFSNTTGADNTATGVDALLKNGTGSNNTATGFQALEFNATGSANTATGFTALEDNTSGVQNTATGEAALLGNTTGSGNTAEGFAAMLDNSTGSNNIALGNSAGRNLTGSNNIDIGNQGIAGESAKIRIGTVGTQTAAFIAGSQGVAVTGSAVLVSSSGQLGVKPSSERFKEAIKPMDKASEAILALKPVTFRYKQEIDRDRTPQFGLVAEEVAKVNPNLVVRDEEGKPYTVRYDAVNAMLLNEFLKEHKTVQEQGAIIALQQKQIEALTAAVQKVSAQLELSKPAPQTVLNNR